MKLNTVAILMASLALASCAGRSDDTHSQSESLPGSTPSSAPDLPDALRKVAPSYSLSGAYNNIKTTPPQVYFYNDPEHPGFRCQSVTHSEGVTTACFELKQ